MQRPSSLSEFPEALVVKVEEWIEVAEGVGQA